MDKIRTSVPSLPKGWVKEVVIRKSGASAGKSDVYYYSPEGKKCRSKPQMLQYLPDDFDIERFDFRAGKNSDSLSRKRKGRKEDYDFGKDFRTSNQSVKPSRQSKKDQNSLQVKVVNSEEADFCSPPTKKKLPTKKNLENDPRRRRAENLSQRCTKPKQLFWQSRLQKFNPVSSQTKEKCKSPNLDGLIKDLLPGSNNESLLNSIWYSLFIGSKVVGQHASLNALRKHPTALCNIDQPFSAPFTITDEALHNQEKKVVAIRKKLTEAQELLKELEAEEDELDEIEE